MRVEIFSSQLCHAYLVLAVLEKVGLLCQNALQIEPLDVQDLVQIHARLFTLQNDRGGIDVPDALAKVTRSV